MIYKLKNKWNEQFLRTFLTYADYFFAVTLSNFTTPIERMLKRSLQTIQHCHTQKESKNSSAVT